MKKFILLWAGIFLSVVFIPLLSGTSPEGAADKKEAPPETARNTSNEISVYMADSGKTETMTLRDYIIGATGAEMPAAFEHDALCAQALCSLTLAVYYSGRPDNSAPGSAAISTDPAVHQAYMSVKEMKKKWGGDFEKYYEKLCAATDEILTYVITYDGEPIVAAFHAVSPGKTESAENVWKNAVPYLVSVDSAGDSFSPKFTSSLTVSADEFSEKLGLSRMDEDTDIPGETVYSDAGTLLSVKLGGKTFTGQQIREAFGLQSNAIKISSKDGEITFSVKGYGHGVGLSQYGADYYARQGMNWREIIAHYYPGTEITDRIEYG